MKTKRILSIVLTLVMLLGLIPSMSLTAYVDGNTTTITSPATTGPMTITLKIKAAQTIAASDVNATYGDTDKAVSASVTTPVTGGGAISYTVKDGSRDYIDVASDGKLTIKAVPPTDGKAYVIVTAAETDDYAATTKEVVVTINKGAQTIAADDVIVTYGETDKKVSASVTDSTEGSGAISYAVKQGSGDYIDVDAASGALTIKKVPADGKAYVTVTAAETATYAQATKEVTVTINKANAVAATVTANNRTYDDVTEKPLVTITGEAAGGEMQYALGTETEATQPYTTSIPTATDAGTYYVWYKVKGDNNHNDSEAKGITVVIVETSLPITSDYIITIPATLDMNKAGYNVTSGIHAQARSGEYFDPCKILTVTAKSAANEAGMGWALVSGENRVGYNLVSDENAAYNMNASPASWTFSSSELNNQEGEVGTTRVMGICVEDYSGKPMGLYTDTVTFTVKMEDITSFN